MLEILLWSSRRELSPSLVMGLGLLLARGKGERLVDILTSSLSCFSPEQHDPFNPTSFTSSLGECRNSRLTQKEAKTRFQRVGKGRNQVVDK